MSKHGVYKNELETLDPDQLDEVRGGGRGGYVQANAQVAGNGGSVIATFGDDGVHFYSAPQAGVGDGVSTTVGGGGWTSTGPGSNFWTGPSTNVSVGAGEGGTVNADHSFNEFGSATGVSGGPGASLTGVGASVSQSNGTEIWQGLSTPINNAIGSTVSMVNAVANAWNAPATPAAANYPQADVNAISNALNSNTADMYQNQANIAAGNVASVQNLEQIASVPHVDTNGQSPWDQQQANQPGQQVTQPGQENNQPTQPTTQTAPQDNNQPTQPTGENAASPPSPPTRTTPTGDPNYPSNQGGSQPEQDNTNGDFGGDSGGGGGGGGGDDGGD